MSTTYRRLQEEIKIYLRTSRSSIHWKKWEWEFQKFSRRHLNFRALCMKVWSKFDILDMGRVQNLIKFHIKYSTILLPINPNSFGLFDLENYAPVLLLSESIMCNALNIFSIQPRLFCIFLFKFLRVTKTTVSYKYFYFQLHSHKIKTEKKRFHQTQNGENKFLFTLFKFSEIFVFINVVCRRLRNFVNSNIDFSQQIVAITMKDKIDEHKFKQKHFFFLKTIININSDLFTYFC